MDSQSGHQSSVRENNFFTSVEQTQKCLQFYNYLVIAFMIWVHENQFYPNM